MNEEEGKEEEEEEKEKEDTETLPGTYRAIIWGKKAKSSNLTEDAKHRPSRNRMIYKHKFTDERHPTSSAKSFIREKQTNSAECFVRPTAYAEGFASDRLSALSPTWRKRLQLLRLCFGSQLIPVQRPFMCFRRTIQDTCDKRQGRVKNYYRETT